MSVIQPATIENTIQSQLNVHIDKMARHDDATEFQLASWNREIGKLAKVDRATACLYWAMLAHVQGKVEDTESFLRESATLKVNPYELDDMSLTVYSNLLMASKSLKFFNQFVSIENQNIGMAINRALICGAFQGTIKLMNQAEAAQIDLTSNIVLKKQYQAALILKKLNISDEDCAKVIDVAGETLRSHKLFWIGRSPKIYSNTDFQFVQIKFEIKATPENAAHMTSETVDKLIELNLHDLPLSVSFVGNLI
jgi:hypothetical protein